MARNFLRWLTFAAVILSTAAPATAVANGEALDGFPNWGERVLLEWMNRARSDPQADLAGCTSANCPDKACYQPVAPRHVADPFEHSARFHATHMLVNGYFDYSSHCNLVSNINALYPSTCGGEASCSCDGGTLTGQTDLFSRIQLFGLMGQAEIKAGAGYTGPDEVFYKFLYIPSGTSMCGGVTERSVLLQSTINAVGAGYTTQGAQTGPIVMDFGQTSVATPKIPTGAHYPQQAASVDAWANWDDTTGPSVAKIDVDGVCSTMSLGRGSQANGAWHLTVNNVGTGCHRYVFAFKDSIGAEQIYPTTGALTIGNGSSQCPDFSRQPPAGCLGFDRIFQSGVEL